MSLKIAIRIFRNNKFFSVLNTLGLALGIACSLLILLWAEDERSVDAFHANKDRLYTVYERVYADSKIDADYETPALLGDQLQKDIPEVQYGVTVDANDSYTFRTGDKTIKEKGGFAGAAFFQVFSFPLLEGDAASALKEPTAIAISKEMAISFFGSPQAAVGKTLQRDSTEGWKSLKITAVFDRPKHSSIDFDFVINME